MKTIHKWPLVADTHIEMPVGSEILTVQMQNGHPQLWALVPAFRTDMCTRTFSIFPTGVPLSESDRKYIGTVQMDEGRLVFHVFETTRGAT